MLDGLQGILPALATPMTANRRLDLDGLGKLVRHVLDGGVHGLWVLGSTGEFPALQEEERRDIITACVTGAKGKIPVVVGVSSLDFRQLIRNAEAAATLGANACFIVLPYYFILDQREAVQYVKDVARAVPLPLVLYDNPFSTNVKFDAASLVEIAESPNVIAIKDSGGDFLRFQKVVASLRSAAKCSLLQGLDQIAAASFLSGACGGVLALANIAPALFVSLYTSALKGDLAAVTGIQKHVMVLCELYEVAGPPTDGAFFAGLKAGLEALDICGRTIAHPFSPLSELKMAQVRAILQRCDIAPLAVTRGEVV